MKNSIKASGKLRKNFIAHNDGFICAYCHEKNPPQKGSYRNHCYNCLYSKHVDQEIPGDRASLCKGLMKPIDIDKEGKKGYIVIHQCIECGKISRNKSAPDDNFDSIIKLSTRKQL